MLDDAIVIDYLYCKYFLLSVEVDDFNGVVIQENGDELVTLIAVKFSDQSNFEIKVRANVLQTIVEYQDFPFFEHNTQEILISASALNHFHDPSLLYSFLLLIL